MAHLLYSSIVKFIFHEFGICDCLKQYTWNRNSMWWKFKGIFLNKELGILSSRGILLSIKFFRHKLYVF